MYHAIVEQKVRQGFREMSKGNYQAAVELFAEDVYFSFSGDHAMGGECRTKAQVSQWFARLYRIFPGIQFEVRSVTVSGWPWNTTATTQFTVRATMRDGQPYQNQAMQFVRLRWGKIVEDIIFEDTHKLVLALNRMAEQGVSEAAAAPIGVLTA
ncbi:MAG: nuclear transport factor 2 family protein [Anaerolineae bacterium]|nr:nuclear transport factor 2 family protein [Anaerolineae bacterium]